MAGTADNGGAFDLVIGKMRQGTEPPPHVHSREDEFFYILSGEMKVYADGEVFQVTAGECMSLPRGKSHAWLITSDEVHLIAVITPGGFFDAINTMNAPAERMEVPADADIVTYANADLTETIKVFPADHKDHPYAAKYLRHAKPVLELEAVAPAPAPTITLHEEPAPPAPTFREPTRPNEPRNYDAPMPVTKAAADKWLAEPAPKAPLSYAPFRRC